jgi:4-amino-4-deoxy-L-arabinose transferase-like glycosyltransferase
VTAPIEKPRAPGGPVRLGPWLILLAAALVAYVVDIGGSSIWDANEAFYVETPREMIERGDYVNPSFNYEPRFNKPVLSYWAVAGLYHLFGVSVAVERAVITAAALSMILAAWLLARAVSPHPAAPLVAALGLAANPRFFMFARRILIDVMLAALMTLVLLFFALSERYPQHRRRFLVAMYVCVGLGVLAKGPVAAVLPAIAFTAYLLVHGEVRRLREMMIPAGTLIALAIAAPWYVALYMDGGWTHIAAFFIGENLERYTSMIGPDGRGPFFYLPVVISDSLPWSLFLPAVIVAAVRERRSQEPDPGRRLRTLLLLWIATIVVFFSFSQTKQDLYIFPIVAAVAVLGGDFVARAVFGRSRAARSVTITLLVASALIGAAGVVTLYVLGREGASFPLAGLRFVGALAIGGAVTSAALALRGHLRPGVAALVTIFVVFNWTMVLRVLPAFEAYKPVVPFSRAIRSHLRDGDLVVQYRTALPSMVFYLQRHVRFLTDREPFLDVMRSGPTVFAVLSERRYRELKDEIAVPTCVLARHPIADVKLRDILARRPPSQLLLVSTRCR